MLDWNGRRRNERPWFTLPPEELAQHGIVVGGSGTGKTVTLLRIAYLAASVYKWKVFYIDAKGDKDTAVRFVAMMRSAGLERIAMFPAQAYNGFSGDGTGILNRLMAIEEYSERFYKSAAKKVLNIVCNKLGEPPRDSADLLSRLEALDLARFRLDKLKSDTIAGVELRYSSFFETMRSKLDGTWSYDDVNAGYVLLDGLALKEEAASLGRYLIEDFANFAGSRKKRNEHALLIVDEYSALSSGADAANLFERLRSFNAGVIVSAQGYDGLGEASEAERMLDAAKFIVLHRSPKPEPFTERAGRKQEITQAHRAEDEVASGSSTVRLEDQPAIAANEPRQLDTGEAIIISKGRWRKIKIAPAPIDVQALAQADAWMQEALEVRTDSTAFYDVQDKDNGEPERLDSGEEGEIVEGTLVKTDDQALVSKVPAIPEQHVGEQEPDEPTSERL